ncbi:hypothetical protein [Streptomyces sp. NPDC050738]|uniref:hypothetical protein n=1 Tax=Streptomyces sp. NPDC050738 TaxID=3154744 RepID=UPI0034317E9E
MKTLWEYGELRFQGQEYGTWTGPVGHSGSVAPGDAVAFLNTLGAAGWEVVSMTHVESTLYGTNLAYLLKREQLR